MQEPGAVGGQLALAVVVALLVQPVPERVPGGEAEVAVRFVPGAQVLVAGLPEVA
jgi:hypothetical protein